MQSKLIASFIVSLTRAIDLMRMQKNPSRYKWDIENLDKIRFYLGGLENSVEEPLERYLRSSITRIFDHLFYLSVKSSKSQSI